MMAISLRRPSKVSNNCFDHGWRKPLEGFIEQQDAHVARQGARDRNHLLLAAGEIVPRDYRAVRDAPGNIRKSVPLSSAHRCGLALQAAKLEILRDAHAGEQAAALRHIADAEPGDLRGGEPDQFAVGEPDRTVRGRRMPISVFNSVDLPAPLRPNSAMISFSCSVKQTSLRMWLLP